MKTRREERTIPLEARQWQTFLLVEDNPLTRKVVRAAVANDDYEMLEAHTGAQALAILDKHTPRVILQDLLLPDQSGFELVRKLRAHPSAAGVPILAFTGLVSQEEEARISNAGFDGLITKPVEPSHLRYLLRGHFATPVRDRPFGSGKRLLIVDDNPVQLKLARFRLSRLGFAIDVAGDGVEALEVARRTKPHAIVTDVLMPRLDGFGLCLELRKDPALANTTVVMATSSYVESADHQLALQVGANAIVIRSADLSEVIRALELAMKTPFVSPRQAQDQTLATTRAERTMRQLERQVALNSGLLQRCAMLSAEVSVLSTVAEALISARDIDEAISDILANCLDVVGASRGAIVSMRADGALTVAALHGLFDPERLTALFAKDSVRRAILEAKEPLRAGELLGGYLATEPAIRDTAIVVSLRAQGQRFGALLIDTPASLSVDENDWHAFANAISNQVSLALALTTAFARVEASEHRVRSLMDSAGDGIFVSREDGQVLEVNPAGERLVGRTLDGIVGAHIDSLIIDEHAVTPAGRRIPVEVSASFVFVGGERVRLHIVRDVSERNAMAAQLRQSQKLEAIGRLAGGVAHDFNNLLSVVLSYSYVLLADRDPSDPIVEDITEIKHAGERASELTSQLLAFSRNQVAQPRVVALNEIVQSSERMLRRLIGQEVALVFALGADVGKVFADPSQVHQVLLNLVVNARDAIPQGRAGRIVVETSNVTIEPQESLAHDGLAPGRYVMLTVADDGLGMDREVRNRIFEPFFTTKGPDKGTGLGLATVFGIVDHAHGRIVVDSAPGRGTIFRVYLPRTDRLALASPAQESKRDPVGDETILVVEDEPQVRTIICSILRRAGYHVFDASSPGDALLVAEQIATPVHLLLTDVVMPRMNGVELAARLAKTRETMKVLLMSGHTGEALGPGDAEVPFLQKPIRPTTLLRSVRDALDGHAPHK